MPGSRQSGDADLSSGARTLARRPPFSMGATGLTNELIFKKGCVAGARHRLRFLAIRRVASRLVEL